MTRTHTHSLSFSPSLSFSLLSSSSLYLGRRERWVYGDAEMPVVNAYKYLGMFFSTRLSYDAVCRDVASKAKRSLLYVMQRLRMYNNYSFDVLFKIFDSQIQPIMSYASEIWGMYNSAQHCEKVHLFAMKKYLRVSLRTRNDFVYKVFNRYPLTVNFSINCIRYWLKLCLMTEDRIPKKAYAMLVSLDEKGKTTWATYVRKCLFRYGFGIVWMEQGVGSTRIFLRVCKERMIDCAWQNWNERVYDSERYCKYRLFCSALNNMPLYFSLEIDRHLQLMCTKFRFGISDIAVHFYRYRQHRQEDLLCSLCKSGIEDEIHFLFCCPWYDNIRTKFIAPKFYNNPCLFRLQVLMSSCNQTTIKNLCIFVYKAFKIREAILSCNSFGTYSVNIPSNSQMNVYMSNCW